MNKLIFFLAAILCVQVANAKKVKFAVDMTGQTISPNGVHVSGDFQTLAGFAGGDWSASSTVLTQEGATSIFSIVVDLPAHAKYEYKFVNGDQFYEVEFVPIESRVGYDFNDNRWLYVDSLANDTTFVGALLFSGNAPAGKTLVRYYVNMSEETVSSDGVHVISTINGFSPLASKMYSFIPDLYELILYTDQTEESFAFLNGNTLATSETIPLACNENDLRNVTITSDTLLTQFCFGSCSAICNGVGIAENSLDEFSVFPNPANDFIQLKSEHGSFETVQLMDMHGKILATFDVVNDAIKIGCDALESGVYFLKISDASTLKATKKIIINHE